MKDTELAVMDRVKKLFGRGAKSPKLKGKAIADPENSSAKSPSQAALPAGPANVQTHAVPVEALAGAEADSSPADSLDGFDPHSESINSIHSTRTSLHLQG